MEMIIKKSIIIISFIGFTLAKPNQWQIADGTEGMDIFDIEFYESNRDTLYATSIYALLISTDMGVSWDSASYSAGGAVIEIDPFDSQRLFFSHGLLPTDGTEVLMTTDGCENWESLFMGFAQLPDLPIIETDPGDLNTIYINVTPSNYYRSSDHGNTWDSIPSPDLYLEGLTSFAISPSNSDIIYVAYFSPPSIYKSTDRSQTWSQIPFPSFSGGLAFIVIHPENPDVLYVAVSAGESRGVYKSIDGGLNWVQMNNGIENLAGFDWINTIKINPKVPEALYLGVSGSSDNGYNPIMFQSIDGAENWLPFSNALPDTHGRVNSITIDTLNHRIYAGTNRGIYFLDYELQIGDINFQIPKSFSLKQNYPNPFNSSTNIIYTLSVKSFVNLTVYDISGKLVKTLINDNRVAGTHNTICNGKDKNGRPVSSGVYLYTLTAKSQETGKMFTQSNKMVFLK